MILKAEIIIDTTDDTIDSEVITILIDALFKDNSHLAKLIFCVVYPPENNKNNKLAAPIRRLVVKCSNRCAAPERDKEQEHPGICVCGGYLTDEENK